MFVLKKTLERALREADANEGHWKNRAYNAEREIDALHRAEKNMVKSHRYEVADLKLEIATFKERQASLEQKLNFKRAVDAKQAYEDALNAKKTADYGANVVKAAGELAGALSRSDASIKKAATARETLRAAEQAVRAACGLY